MKDIVSVCIPYIRPNNMPVLIENVLSRSGISNIEIVAEEDRERIGCPKMLKRLVDKSKGNYVCFIGDDTEPQIDFLYNALDDMYCMLGCSGLIGLSDGIKGRTIATHWVASKDLLPSLGGEFFHTGYYHGYCDVELMERCKQMGKFFYSENSVVLHHHPYLNTSIDSDDDYRRVYSKEFYLPDRKLYQKRKNNGWK